ncbi:MAG: response regulator [Rhodopseudomonas sp.]|nr:response regulator [Rhodopseudomonas sp.]
MKQPSKALKVLVIEDNEDDLALLLRALRQGGYEPNCKRVDNAEALGAALAAETWDIVLTDCHLPAFSGIKAINTVRDIAGANIPIIVVSGTIGEEAAVELIRAGAQDYVHKSKLGRLPLAIEREINAAATRKGKLASEKKLILERENFISIVAHDLRAPVQRIETMVKVLRSDYESQFDDDGRDIVFRIERSASRLRLMLGSLTAYSRYGRTATRGKIASLANTIDEVLEEIGIDMTNTDLRISLGDINWVKGDAILLGHIVQNLVSNAYKFRRKDKHFSIHIEAVPIDHGRVQVSVTDNGIGIEPRYADKVFEIFYRLHDDDEYEGTGIGLAICKKIVGDHGGDIWVDKTYTGGARIVFTLERADETSETLDAPAANVLRFSHPNGFSGHELQ